MKPLEDSLEKFYEEVRNSRRIDDSFALEDDEDLTSEELAIIDAYWGRYKFAYPEIDYKSFKTFKNRYGAFDVRHCPGAIRSKYIAPHFVPEEYRWALQNKAMLPILFPDALQPKMVVCSMEGIFFSNKYSPITEAEAIKLVTKKLKKGVELIVKPSGLGGGRGIRFLDKSMNDKDVEVVFSEKCGDTFVVQEVMQQSEFMGAFNYDSVNTIRATSMLYKEEYRLMAALVRVGNPGSRIDNFSKGGSIIGVDSDTGLCNKWALKKNNERVTVLESGLDLEKQDLILPNFASVKDFIKDMHYRIPYIKMVSWDIALDSACNPVLIENNFYGEIQLHEAVTGPIFGQKLDEILDEFLLEKFHVTYVRNGWKCKEYSDRIEIFADESDASKELPIMLNGKPVLLRR